MYEVFLDALNDTLKILPVLLLVHLLIEIVERYTGKLRPEFLRGGFSPLIGAAVGTLPQCGFSVVATNLYIKKYIPLGTLLAVYIATSDEAIPILLASPQSLPKLLPLIGIKFALALAAGYAAYLLLGRKTAANRVETPLVAECNCGCSQHEEGEEGHSMRAVGENDYWAEAFHPLRHSLSVLAYIFAVNMFLGVLIYEFGEGVNAFLDGLGFWQPFAAALVGLIPNCASSVAITQMYALGHLSLGSAVAGLTVGAGLGIAVLIKDNPDRKKTFLIIISLLAIGICAGLVTDAVCALL